MKNICGKIPDELHEKVREEIEEKESSTQIFLQQVIEEHFQRIEGDGQMSVGIKTVAVQVSEELFQRLKAIIPGYDGNQKQFLIEMLEEAITKEEERQGIKEVSQGEAEQSE